MENVLRSDRGEGINLQSSAFMRQRFTAQLRNEQRLHATLN
jgi:hypothetical protein